MSGARRTVSHMEKNPCPKCGRDRGVSQLVLGVDAHGSPVLSPEYPSDICFPCDQGYPIDGEWPRPIKPEYKDMPKTACGYPIRPDGSLVPRDEMYL